LILFISVTVIAMMRRLPYFFVGWLWYVITILPTMVIGITQLGEFAMADRYHYLPSIGITVMLAWGIPFLIPREDTRKKMLFPAAIFFLAIMSVLAWQQCGYWKNSIELWNHALQVTKNNYMAHNNLASALFEKGETQKAIYHYNKVIRITNYAPAYYNMGIIYYRLGQHQRAIENFSEAIRIKPDYFNAYNNRGIVYNYLGQYQNAIENYSETIRLKPDYSDAYNNRAVAFLKQGNTKLGCYDAQKACALGVCTTLEVAKLKGYCN
jgi:tetratricopeptide (TPR) repeat protein